MPNVTDQQVRKLMETYTKTGGIARASMAAGMDRRTGAKYIASGKLPSQLARERAPRDYRTHDDAFEVVWPEVVSRLEDAPELEAKALFNYLMEREFQVAEQLREAGDDAAADEILVFDPGQLRTFQRRVKRWRAEFGPDRAVFFSQEHRPGEAMQTDFTWATELAVTINGEVLEHMLCHSVLPYSNWQWATPCRSENFVALRQGFQNATVRLGRQPEFHQTDQSTTATHKVGDSTKFNDDYKALMKHYGLTPRTIGVGQKEQNGDIEAANGALKRRLKQHLLLRGSHDFDTLDDYTTFLNGVLQGANKLRQKRVAEELAVMRQLNVSRVPDYKPVRLRVSQGSTVRVKENVYSVPSRLIGEQVEARIYDSFIEIWYAQKRQISVPRLIGRKGFNVNYRHIIWSMVRKPGAFRNYRYRQAMFPTATFRAAFDAIEKRLGAGYKADLEYLRILHHAAATMESEVDVAVGLLLESDKRLSVEAVKDLVGIEKKATVPKLQVRVPELRAFDVFHRFGGQS